MATLPVRARDETWMAEAACSGKPTEAFFPQHEVVTPAARQLCEDCPVAGDCLAYALEHYERGIWAGTTFNQRQEIRRQQRRPAA